MTITAHLCSSCQTSLPSDARFCPRCGVSVAGTTGSSRRAPPWLAAAGAAGAVLLALGLVVWRGGALRRDVRSGSIARPVEPVNSAEVIPDMSRLAPKERFDRLYGRIMQALRVGDTATLSRIAPMALAAYVMLDSTEVDSITRRRVALLHLHLGDTTTVVTRAPALP